MSGSAVWRWRETPSGQCMSEMATASSDPLPCLAIRGDGVLLQLSVMPNAKRTEVDGLHDGALRVRLAAPPIDGRANEALIAWLAKSLGVPKRDVEVLRGEASRCKQVAIAVSHDIAVRWLTGQVGVQRPRWRTTLPPGWISRLRAE
jgi:uncharacterized protein